MCILLKERIRFSSFLSVKNTADKPWPSEKNQHVTRQVVGLDPEVVRAQMFFSCEGIFKGGQKEDFKFSNSRKPLLLQLIRILVLNVENRVIRLNRTGVVTSIDDSSPP